ncbi:MAG: hypothetical protein GTO17_07230 [Candidatus Aminicenantes bacterium]|nr:hypothetical protein [Candidatus Aminicenantes bacterium]
MTNKRICTWELERYLLGELPPSRMAEITKLAHEDPDIKKEVDQLSQANAEILRRNPSETMLPEILRKYDENRRQEQISEKARLITKKRLIYTTPVLVSAIILLFIVFMKEGVAPDYTRVKGEESLDFRKTQIVIYKKNNSEISLLHNGDQVKAGDLLQLAYVPAGKTYGVIFSIDGNGVVTLHHPERKSGSSILKQEKKNLLLSAYELDNAPDFERFFFITAMEEIEVQRVIKKAEELALSLASARTTRLELPESYSQFSILLQKEK